MAQIPGSNISAGVRPNDSADTYDTHSAEYGRGGYHTGHSDVAARDAIPVERRQWWMVVPLLDGTKYELVPGLHSQDLLDNQNWRVWQSGTGTPFTPIAENEFGTHPAFTSQPSLNAYLLGRAGTAPTEGFEIIDVIVGETFTISNVLVG
jgi:hypothetical protein